MTKKEILIEARRLFPIGTEFYPAHASSKPYNGYCIVTVDSDFQQNFANDRITLVVKGCGYTLDSKDKPSKYGNTTYNRIIRENGRWAEIRTPVIPKQLPIFN